MEKAERRKRSVELVVTQNLTYAQAADHLGVSNATIAKDLRDALDELTVLTLLPLAQAREVELQRLARNDRAILPILYGKGTDGHNMVGAPTRVAEVKLSAHEKLVASSRERAKLTGLYAPVKVAQTDPSGERKYHDLSDEELLEALRKRETEKLPVIEGTVVKKEEPK
jgi:hypothetical protein